MANATHKDVVSGEHVQIIRNGRYLEVRRQDGSVSAYGAAAFKAARYQKIKR